jgi:hypothetical protein
MSGARISGYAETVELSRDCIVILGARRGAAPRLSCPDLDVDAFDLLPQNVEPIEGLANMSRASGVHGLGLKDRHGRAAELRLDGAAAARLLDAVRRAFSFSAGQADG